MSEEQSNINGLSIGDIADLRKIVLDGNRNAEDYQIKIYKEVYDKDVSVKIRALSNYEYDLISIDMYSEIQDPDTIEYLFNPDNEKELKELANNKEKKKKKLKPKDTEISKAYLLRNVLISYYAMKDFIEGLTIDDVKKMEGISEIAKRVNEKSGRTKEIIDKLTFFREKQLRNNN